MKKWERILDSFEIDDNMHLLVLEEDGKVVSTVQMAIIESLTHNVRPFAVIENVVTHIDYRNRGMHRLCWQKRQISPENIIAIKFHLKQVQIKKAPWIFIEITALQSMRNIPA